MFRSFTFAAAIVLLSGCVSTSYIQPQLPDAQVAIVSGESSFDHKVLQGLDERVAILTVDGASASASWGGGFPTKVNVSPGRHYFDVRYGFFGKYADGKLWIDTEAGKKYFIRHDSDGVKVRLWAVEVATGAVVGGPPGTEPAP